MSRKQLALPSLLIMLIAIIAAPLQVQAAGTQPGIDLSFLDGLTLVVLESDDVQALHTVRSVIIDNGGNVAIMAPPSVLLAWIPDSGRAAVATHPLVRSLYSTEVLPGEVTTRSDAEQGIVSFFNRAMRGELDTTFEELPTAPGNTGTAERLPDALTAPAVDLADVEKNLEGLGIDTRALKDLGLLPQTSTTGTLGNSDFMTGTVAVTLFFVESDGSGSDPDMYSWTPEDMQAYLDGAATGLAWWSSQATQNFGCSVSFLINYHSGADPRCQQWAEPILHGSNWESVWVNNVITNFGYTSGSRFAKVTAFNTWQRSYYGTDRSYSSFIPYNPAPASATFPGGGTAFAYLGGPYSVLLFNVQGWTTMQVYAHESGHIFWACDEYNGGCSSCSSTCGNGVANGNCETCNPSSRDCMMKFNTFSLCDFTKGQIGWGINNPCSPPPSPPLPTPAAAISYPASGLQGTGMTITVGGTNFFPGAVVDLGPNIFVNITTLVGAESLVVDVTILPNAPLGAVDVTVRNQDGQTTTLTGAFEVAPTLRHYYSPAGANVFPYISPGTAATALSDAMAAAFDGDTVFVPTSTINLTYFAIDHGVTLNGAWDANFTQRDLAGGKTVLNLTGNILIGPNLQNVGLDGFILENGVGSPGTDPFAANFGGAVQVLTSSVRIANCEIRLNAATPDANYGVGGGIFAKNSTVDLRDNFIHQNTATQGGGIYLYNCSGVIQGNTISTNSVSTSSSSEEGAGIMLVKCSGISFVDNTITANIGAISGGGVLLDSCTTITMTGGSIANNQALGQSGKGGGLCARVSNVTVSGTMFSDNSATLTGGAVSVSASNVTMSECFVTLNAALLGGGLYASDGTTDVQHNLFTANDGSASGGAIFITGAASGSVIGNTLDANTSPGTGGILLGDLPIEVANNIVTGSTGTGISCSSGTSLSLSYNLVWGNSGGDYSGCTVGPGSISADPLFANSGLGDYHLALHSPAIDAGKPDAALQDPDGSRGDIGWYGSHAFTMAQPSHPLNLAVTANGSNVDLSWSQSPENDVASYAIYSDATTGFIPSATNFVMLVPAADSTATVPLAGDSTYYVVSAVDSSGYASGYSNEAALSVATGIGTPGAYTFALRQNVPNPFNPVTRISYELQSRANVVLTVFDVDGRLVKRLVRTSQSPGTYSVTWNGDNEQGSRVASGIYFYRLEAGRFTQTKKMVLLK